MSASHEDRRSDIDGGHLFVCSTPIGNLDDVTPRLRAVLAAVDVIACEDTRRTRALLSALAIPAPRVLSHRAANEDASSRGIIGMLGDGLDVALVSDAGAPAVSDPGSLLVRRALDEGLTITCIAGPSALTAALSVAGCSTVGNVRFVGFFPRSAREMTQLMRHSASEVVVGFEAPGRTVRTLDAIASIQPGRRVVVARELTKVHEQVIAGEASEVAVRFTEGEIRGEVVIVCDVDQVAIERPWALGRASELAAAMIEAGVGRKTACALASRHHGIRSKEVYDSLLDA